MHLFIPSFDAARTDHALQEACRIVQPGDRVTIVAPVIVPAGLPLEVGAGESWKRACEAERRLFDAREMAEQPLPRGVHLRCMRVRARDWRSAVLAGIANHRDRVDCMLLALPGGMRGAPKRRVSAIPALLRDAPCAVRFVGGTTDAEPRASELGRDDGAPRCALQVVAINPTFVGPGSEHGLRKPEGQHAS